MGVWLYDEQVLARTWFRTVRIPRSVLDSCSTGPYWGGFSGGFQTSWLRELEVSTADGAVYELGGTIAFRSLSELQACQVSAYIQGAPSAEALSVARARFDDREGKTGSGRHA